MRNTANPFGYPIGLFIGCYKICLEDTSTLSWQYSFWTRLTRHRFCSFLTVSEAHQEIGGTESPQSGTADLHLWREDPRSKDKSEYWCFRHRPFRGRMNNEEIVFVFQDVQHNCQLHRISFCADDKTDKRIFTFICKDSESNKHLCYVFDSEKCVSVFLPCCPAQQHLCVPHERSVSGKVSQSSALLLQAEEITLTIGQAFDLAYKKFLESGGKDVETRKQIGSLQKRVSSSFIHHSHCVATPSFRQRCWFTFHDWQSEKKLIKMNDVHGAELFHMLLH